MKLPIAISLAAFVFLSTACDRKTTATGDPGTTATGGGATRAPGTVVLATKHHLPPVGSVVTKEMSMKMAGAKLDIEAGGQKMNGTADQSSTNKETMEVLSNDKLRWTVVNRTTGGKMTINGQDQSTPSQPAALQGVPLILERKGATWTAKLESGAAATADQQTEIDKIVNGLNKDSDFEMYGDTPRKPGDKWTVDPSRLANFGDTEESSGTCSVEFVEIADFEGTRCAVLKSTFAIKGKAATRGKGAAMDVHFNAEAISHRSLADQLDLSVDINGTMGVDGAPAPEVEMHMEGPMTMTETNTLKKP